MDGGEGDDHARASPPLILLSCLRPPIQSRTKLLEMPPLQTQRLSIRPFVRDDLDVVHRILDIELRDVDWGEPSMTLDERARWLGDCAGLRGAREASPTAIWRSGDRPQ